MKCDFRSCGKDLWKNLWILWKSVGFQQLFRVFTISRPQEKDCICQCIYESAGKNIKLCRRGNLGVIKQSLWKKLAKCQIEPMENSRIPEGGKNLCGKFTNLLTV